MCQRLSKCKCDETFYLRPHPLTLPHRHPATFLFLLHINYQHLTVFQRLSEYKHDENFCPGIHPCTPPLRQTVTFRFLLHKKRCAQTKP